MSSRALSRTPSSPRRRSRGCRSACACTSARHASRAGPSPCTTTTTATTAHPCGRSRRRRLLLRRRRVRAQRCGRGSYPVLRPLVTPGSGPTSKAATQA
uniref:Uncharacterized protein n=1 Tax=Arundo donax TaxID=35708 RepID=A0A0A9B0Z3_ARUDO